MASIHAPRSTRRVCYSVAQLQKIRRSGDSKTIPRGRINAALVRLAKRNERETLALFAPGLSAGLLDEQNQKLQRTEDERDMLEKALNDAEEKITKQTALLQAGIELRHWDNTFQDYMHTFGDVGREFTRASERVVNEDRGGPREVAHLWDKVQDYFEEMKELRDKLHTLHVAAKERFEEDEDDDESLYEDAPIVMD